jgi:hypothetical protein
MGTLLSIVSFLTSPLGRWVGGALLVAVLAGGIYWKGDSNGYARAMAKVERQQQRAIKLASKAREQLEKACERDSDACVPEDWFRDED